jgi:membrane-bound lytic murein transglycosylase D
MAFLPSAANPTTAVPDIAEPPAVEPSGIYVHTTPSIIGPRIPGPMVSERAQAMMDKAEQRYQRGRRLYQANDTERARKEFDSAIDLMMEASDQPVTDRQAFDRRFDQMVDAIHRYDLAGLGSGVNGEQAQFEKAPLEDILEMTFPVDPKLKSRVREQIKATASQLPLSINDAVLGYIHYFMGRGHKTLVYGLERSGRYKPMIQRILDEEGVPQELIHLAQAESGFLPRAVSRKAATGMWQFMAFRGQQYGLMRTSYSDDRLDPERATRAAARHLRDLYTEFGDWYLAIAAYNCGPGVVEKAVERTGYADFWELRNRRVLPAETTNYVPIILAMTIMAKNAAEYGIADITPDPAMEYDTVELSASTHLALVADLTDAPVSELMALNPSLLKTTAPEKFALHVPKGTANSVMASLEMVPPERRASWRIHRVESGETLADIGKRYGAAPASIAEVNRLSEAGPAAGDRLVVPAAGTVERSVKAATRRTSARTAKSRTSHKHTVVAKSTKKTAAKSVTATATSKRGSAKKSTAAATVRRGPVSASSRTRSRAATN